MRRLLEEVVAHFGLESPSDLNRSYNSPTTILVASARQARPEAREMPALGPFATRQCVSSGEFAHVWPVLGAMGAGVMTRKSKKGRKSRVFC